MASGLRVAGATSAPAPALRLRATQGASLTASVRVHSLSCRRLRAGIDLHQPSPWPVPYQRGQPARKSPRSRTAPGAPDFDRYGGSMSSSLTSPRLRVLSLPASLLESAHRTSRASALNARAGSLLDSTWRASPTDG